MTDAAQRMSPPFDPRLRIVFSLVTAAVFLSTHHHLVLAGIVAALVVLGSTDVGVGVRTLLRRIVAVNLFATVLVLTLPWSVPGEPLVEWGMLSYSINGLFDASRIALKANAVVLAMTILLTPVEPMALGQAAAQLGAPLRLVQLYFLTLRYLRVLDEEYRRLRRAMQMRGFRARANLHTLRAFGYLVGMLLIRAMDRAERIWEAMLCRGFSGQFPRMYNLRVRMADTLIAACLLAALGVVLGADRALATW